MSKFMTTTEVSEVTRVPVESLRWMRRVGQGPKSFRLGRHVLYAVEDVESWVSEAREAATAA